MNPFTCYPKNHLLGADGMFHEVDPVVYKDYKKNLDHEEYCIKRDRTPGRNTGFRSRGSALERFLSKDSLPRVVSINKIEEAHGEALLPRSGSAEDTALDHICSQAVYSTLYKAIASLTPDERFIIQKIYFEGMSGRDFEKLTGISRTTMQYRKSLVLKKLKDLMVTDIKGCSPDVIHEVIYN